MREEICAAVNFFVYFIEKSDTFPRDQLDNFQRHLTELLLQRFEKHWFPELPYRGQGYRCIRVNGLCPVDLTLQMAATKCGLRYTDLRLPTELTVWVDPNEVCYRLGESEGSYCTLATFPSSDASSIVSSKLSASSVIGSAASSVSSLDVSSQSSGSASASPAVSLDGSPVPSPVSTPPLQEIRTQNQHQSHQVNNNRGRHQQNKSNNQRHLQNGFPGGFDFQQSLNGNGRYQNGRNQNQGGYMNQSSALRSKQSPREMNFNFNPNHRPHSGGVYNRCDGPPYPPMAPPPFYHHRNHHQMGYNNTRYNHKNILRV